VTRLGAAGLQPNAWDKETPSAAEIVETVRAELLPLERNFFRQADALRNSLGRLDSAWSDLRRQAPADGLAAAKMREAAAMIATSRWAYASALARTESRGMHRRIDVPAADPGFVCAFEAAGLDRVGVTRRELREGAPAR
jgi:succinate dehydrogenase/fumarate reductase flavoprotein subunit